MPTFLQSCALLWFSGEAMSKAARLTHEHLMQGQRVVLC